jgi:hypothetical protein
MELLNDEFEKKVVQLVDEYSGNGMNLSDQVTVLGYLCLELCQKIFPDARIGYTHFLTILIQRIIFDMGELSEENKDKDKPKIH